MKRWLDERKQADGQTIGVVPAAPAATVVLLRDGDAGLEVLLAKRSSSLKFHGGAWVFPGGRIDPADYADDPTDLVAAARRGAAREAKEESGLDVDPDALVHLSNWTTPEISPKRFATWFFIGPVAGGSELADGSETDELKWFRPSDALAARDADDIELAPPQYVTLLALCEYGTVAAAMAAIDEAEAVDFIPRFHFVDNGAICVYTDDVAYHDLGRLDDEGTRHRLYLSDDGWKYVRD